MNKKKGQVLGYAEFGAFLHRDNGGKARVSAYTSVNKPLSVENHDETTKIASRRYKILEEETAELDGNKFYNKDIWNVQEEDGKETQNASSNRRYDPNEDINDDDNDEKPKSKEMTPLAVLKNFVDNIAMDVRQIRDHNILMWVFIIGAVVLGVSAFVISVMK